MSRPVWQPSSCPVCRMGNGGSSKFTTLMRNLDDLSRVEFQCGFCHSIFWWKKETREACGLESRYPLTRQGWDTSIKHIDPKYLAGDICPRCDGDKNYQETLRPGKCVVCDGGGVLRPDDV